MAHYAEARQIRMALLAEPGIAEAWFNLEILAEDGLGEARHAGEARRRCEQAAEAGEAEAQYALSVMLDTGAGQPCNLEEALRWLRASTTGRHQPTIKALKDR